MTACKKVTATHRSSRSDATSTHNSALISRRRSCFGLGVFGGKYMSDCRDEFPRSWFSSAKLATGAADASLNFFGVGASQPLSEWRRKGWVHPADPRGWFQWYYRYYMGRRLPEEDSRQIKR
jgi:hypothetical protein